MRPRPVLASGVMAKPKPPPPDAATRQANIERRKRMAFVVLGVVAVLFVIQIVALAVGLLEISFLIFAVIVAGWFALRSYQTRYPI